MRVPNPTDIVSDAATHAIIAEANMQERLDTLTVGETAIYMKNLLCYEYV